MKYCYIDESGNPKIKDARPFIVGMVVFDSLDAVDEAIREIEAFRRRNNIANDYEFHFSRNSSKNKNRYRKFIEKSGFNTKAFIIKKRPNQDSYNTAANEIVEYLDSNVAYNVRIDSNPLLFKALRTAFRARKIRAKITQVNSKNNDLIQVADYVAGAALKSLKLKKLP